MDNLLRLLVLVGVVAICHRVICQELDPAVPCKQSDDCIMFSNTLKNATCKNGYCYCGTSTEHTICSSQNIPRDSGRNTASYSIRNCKIDNTCTLKNSFCNTTIGQCECQKDFVFATDKKVCLKKANAIDFPCVETKQCLAFLQNTTCRNSQCKCIDDYHYFQSQCYKSIEFGATCTRSEECAHVEGAICNDNSVCHCAAETVISSSKKNCLHVAKEIPANCTEDQQCTVTFPNMHCMDMQCECIHNYHFEPERSACVVNRGFNENCANTFECYQTGDNTMTKAMHCVENICECAEGFERNEDKCISSEGTRLLATLSPFLLLVFVRVAFSRQI